jgi:phospholipid/cholesterol/gamma-HCH transport system substrate-binding protein
VNVRPSWLAIPSTLLVALALASCGSSGSSGQRTATAVFSDVGDLANGAQVQLANVPIGSVTSIALDGDKAKVTMEFSKSVRVPANVTAALESTTILGDQYVALEVPSNEISARDSQVALLPNGGLIRHTTVIPGLEQLVQSGAQVFGAISTTEIENIIAAGGEGFTAQEASLKDLLSDLSTVATGYSQHTSDITEAVNGLNQLSSTLAPSSGANAAALTTLSKTVAILAQNSAQFETLLQSIDNLSIQGRGILETYYPQIVDQLQTLEAVSSQLSQNQADLVGILDELPLNNSALPSSVRDGFIQVFENLIICGIPGGGEDDSSPAFTCAPTTNSSKK